MDLVFLLCQLITNEDALARGLITGEDLLAGTSISCEVSHVCNVVSEEWVKFWRKNFLHSKKRFREWECGGSLWTGFWRVVNEEMSRFVDFF